MATDKEILRKLFKIAEKQQRIIRKLAQQSIMLDTAMINASIASLTTLKAISANASQVGEDWAAHITLSVPPGQEAEFARAEGLLQSMLNRIRFVNLENNQDVKVSSITVHQG